jgi:uncharacterized protein (UPF0335 family)
MSDTESVAQSQLKSFIECIERLNEEKQSIQEDIKDKYGEAKASGYDTKILRQVIKLRKLSSQEREETEALLDTYMSALGM